MKLFGGKQTEQRSSLPPVPRRRILATLVAVACALAALAGGAALLLRPRPKTIAAEGSVPAQASIRPAVEPQRVLATPPPTEAPLETPEPVPEPPSRRGGSLSFILLGRPDPDSAADLLMAGRFDPETGSLDAVSIPRDTLVDVDWDIKKAATLMKFDNDPERLSEHLSGLLGFSPDRYLILDAAAAAGLIDALGGVYYNAEQNFDYDDPYQDLHIHVPAGLQWLGGKDAVHVLRFLTGNNGTGYPDGDLGRIRTQQSLLGALARQIAAAGTLPEEAGRILAERAETNLTSAEFTGFAAALSGMDAENLRFFTAPGTAVCIRGGYYYQLDPDEWLELVNRALNPWSVPVKLSSLDILREFGEEGAVSTNGTVVPMDRFFNYDDF